MADDHRHDGKTSKCAASDLAVSQPICMTDTSLNHTHLATLTNGAMSSEWNASQTAVEQVLAAGVSAADIADRYIPTIARDMGEQWCRDEMGFATVTIGASRLQSMLRQLGPAWASDSVTPPDAPTVLVVVAQDIYHTLGAMVLAGQLRRKGASVRLVLGATPPEVATQTTQLKYDAVFLSASCGESLESLRKIVDSVAQSGPHPTPVVLGGTILMDAPNAKALTGATFTTNDPDEALALCGLKENLQKMTFQRQGSS